MGNDTSAAESVSAPAAPSAAGRRVAGMLVAHRHEAALYLLNSISDRPRWRAEIAAATGEGSIDFFQPVLFVFVDYLSLFFATADPMWKQLYVGEKLKLLHEPGVCPAEDQQCREKLADDDQRGLMSAFRYKLSPGELQELERGLADITALLTTAPERRVRVLLIGDFLQLDVLGWLWAGALERRITLDPICIANTDPTTLHAAIRGLAGVAFDLILYTPFSDLDCRAVTKLGCWRMLLAPGRSVACSADAALLQATTTIDLLSTLWASPIFVSNASAIARHGDSASEWLRHTATGRLRTEFCALVNRSLVDYVEAKCQSAEAIVTVFDEHALLATHDPWLLGQTPWVSDRKYPILLGRHAAAGYCAQIAAFCRDRRPALGLPQQIIRGEDRSVSAGKTVNPIAPTALG